MTVAAPFQCVTFLEPEPEPEPAPEVMKCPLAQVSPACMERGVEDTGCHATTTAQISAASLVHVVTNALLSAEL